MVIALIVNLRLRSTQPTKMTAKDVDIPGFGKAGAGAIQTCP
jgi:hypothetical protein